MPTLQEVVQKPPNTPWRTVSDIYQKKPKIGRRRQQVLQQQQQQQQRGGEEQEEEEMDS